MAAQATDHAAERIETFDAAALQTDFAFLADCPDALFDDIVALPVGGLEERVRGILSWRDALLQGRLPPADAWPHEAVSGVREALEVLGIARFCLEQPHLVDELLGDILTAIRGRAEVLDDLRTRLRELEKMARSGLERNVAELAEKWHAGRVANECEPSMDEKALDQLRQDLERDASQGLVRAGMTLVEAWEERVRVWTEVADVFGNLGMLLGRGWDLSLGVLRHVGWRELLALREVLDRLPQLREIVRSLGRLQTSDSPDTDDSVSDRLFGPVRRLEEELREIRTPLVPEETKGVELSDAIPRMLPSEAAMLGHPILRYVWHARRAERALLTYRVEGVELERSWVERERMVEHPAPRRNRGPIVAVIDTSGSMHGTPETVAKALVLETLRTAHAERRRCYVYAFSGPGQVAEQELDLSAEGIGRLLDFLGMSFHGGTDPREVMNLVVERLSEPDWRKADVLLASDGRWLAPDGDAVSRIRSARDVGTRFHGVQIGNRGATALATICDPVHEFDTWLDVA